MVCAASHLNDHEVVVAAAVDVPSRDRIRVISTVEKLHQYGEVAKALSFERSVA